MIVDDYAHHPNEINVTLDSLKLLTKGKLTVFEPHRVTRLRALK